ncbi:MAG: DNA mismatch repair protein MutL [Opitutia bacterium Tous-C10FEB]|nr:MAG: DNA mismatch repair protein MutL [Opitutae bacterium Tous-C10FEB]
MSVIRILTERVANQIAAGEVIERPAAVVKELVENSLDAGATRVEVEFRAGGRALIRVVDNGCGMTQEDALLSLERHATSKLVETADLDRLGTFGFRGEAVPSIASVSHFELQTRVGSAAAGTEIVINGGKFVHVRECGLAPGTSITVSHLFNSVPARRKFLKTDATESAHIIQTVRLYALACPATAFVLIEDGRVLFQSPVCTTLAERVGEIFGRQLVADLLPVAMAEAGLKLSGLIGKPGVNRSTRHELLMFVNRRPVDSRTLNYALIESYATALAKGRYPVAVLFLELDPAAVDVNVHPAKREVRFRSEGAVRGFVIRAVLQRLREWGAPAPRVEPASAGQVHPAASEVMPGDPVSLAAPATVNLPPTAFVIKPPAPPAIVRTAVAPLAVSAPSASAALLGWRFLGTAHSDYALWETPSGLMVLDRRAAHERVWFERLEMQFKQGAVASQRLLFAIPVEFDAIASALLTDQLAFLQRHGFAVAEFGRNFFRIEAVPVWLESSDAVIFLRDIIGLMRDGQLDGKNLDLARTALAQLAAQQAVRLPSSHNETEALALVSQLFACTQPHTSPAGRPTHFELSRGELLRRFQR